MYGGVTNNGYIPTRRMCVMQNETPFEWVAFGLCILGALNWGLMGLFGLDAVAAVGGSIPYVSRGLYTLLGLAGFYGCYALFLKCIDN